MARVHTAISDLFFNTDHDTAATYERGVFKGYARTELLEQARAVLGCLEDLGVGSLPTPQDLVDDFMRRL
jgi:hypothetical protein